MPRNLVAVIKCQRLTKSGKPCQKDCPAGSTECKVHIALNKKYPGQCTRFRENGELCLGTCPKKGFSICTRCQKKEKTMILRSTESSSESSNQIYILNSDNEDEGQLVLYSSEEDEEESDLKEGQRLKKNQCMCFNDNGNRCKKVTAYGNLYYCEEHKDGTCRKGSKFEVLKAERENRPGRKLNCSADQCCGQLKDGKCTYNMCNDDCDVDPSMANKALIRARNAGNTEAATRIKNRMDNKNICEGCGIEYTTTVKVTTSKISEGNYKVCTKARDGLANCTTKQIAEIEG